MIYKKRISMWRQKRWFKSINNMYNYYFLIQYNGDFIGLVNGKDADFENKTMEGGIFIWDSNYWDTHIPMLATIIMHDCSFFISNFKTLSAKIVNKNKNAINFNLSLGYKIITQQTDISLMKLTKEDFVLTSQKIRKSIIQLTKDSEKLNSTNISFKDEDEKSMKLLYSNLPVDVYNNFFNR
ncbi:MAG: GNAT family N-acetyltransferase [Vicingaceae bacterium]|nr:GNAT family N-acetyltransferase [Vicingaceae bacterium]